MVESLSRGRETVWKKMGKSSKCVGSGKKIIIFAIKLPAPGDFQVRRYYAFGSLKLYLPYLPQEPGIYYLQIFAVKDQKQGKRTGRNGYFIRQINFMSS